MGMVGPQDYVPIRRLYEKALQDGHGVFRYKEQDILVSYAYYLLEYLKPQAENMGVAGVYVYKPAIKRPSADKESSGV